MYTLVLMTALSPGADVTPAPVPVPVVAGCCGVPVGCTGCTGYTASAGCYGSCYGSSCYGSCTGHMRAHGHGLFGHKRSCHGCSGYSCSGYNCFGSSCLGDLGCAGGVGFGGGASSWGPPIGMPPYTLHGYNQGGAWGYGPPVVYADSQAVYGRVTNLNPQPLPPVDPTAKPMTPPTPPKGMGANIKFRLPADAKLYVDGKETMLIGTERAFTTPALEAGQKFFYDVKAELMVDGKPVVEEKRVIVEAGSELTETFPKLIAAAKAKGDPVAGK